MLSQSQVAALLGRPLSSTETTHFKVYIGKATEQLQRLLGLDLCIDSGARTFDARCGYRTLYIDPCTSVTTVTIDDSPLTTYTKKQNDSYRGDWFNILEFDDQLNGGRVVVTAEWGFGESLPSDLAGLLAGLFATRELEIGNVQSKEIEDYRVTYRATPAVNSLIAAHADTIAKYMRPAGGIEHGRV